MIHAHRLLFMVTAVLSQLIMFVLLGAASSIAHAGHSMC